MAGRENDDFYNSQTPSSFVKAKIVAEYFPQYARILLRKNQKEIRYLDLFAGPGRYRDGKHSTPLLLAKACADDILLSSKVRLLFNDKTYIEELKANFNEHFPNGTFHFEARFGDKVVGESADITTYLSKSIPRSNPYPTLLFFDPWGYKGIDTRVLAKFLGGWGNELFLYVNTKRIHAAIENEKFDELMRALFPGAIDKLRKDRKYNAVAVYERVNLIIATLVAEFQRMSRGQIYYCPFRFQEEDSKATSHFILHFTKHTKGYALVKQVYNNYDNIGATLDKEGTYTFDAKRMGSPSSTLDFGDQNIKALSESLIREYKGKKIAASRLFELHQKSTKYSGLHYLQTFRHMVGIGLVQAKFTDNSNHKVNVLLNDHCILEFK